MKNDTGKNKDDQKKPEEIPERPDLERVKAVLPLWELLKKLIRFGNDKKVEAKPKKSNDIELPNQIEEKRKPKPGCKN